MKELIVLAKSGDKSAKEEIIKMYYPLIVKEAKGVFLKEKTFEDLIQIGIVNLLKSIEKFDISRNCASFSSYILWSIKNGYRYLCRSEIRYNSELSINKTTDDGYEFGDGILDSSINIENTFISDLISNNLYLALESLDKEEREIIEFLYLKYEKPNLSKYCKENNKDYYYCSCLKRRALTKLKKTLIEFYWSYLTKKK